MTHPARLIIPALLAAALLAACDRAPQPTPAEEVLLESGPVPPPAAIDDFTAHNLLSEFPGTIRSSDYEGKVQLIVFFLADDPSTPARLPDWNALSADLSADDFALIGLVADLRPASEVEPPTRALAPAPAFPVGQMDASILIAFGGPDVIHAVPTTFLLDRQGRLQQIYTAHEPIANIREDIQALLDGRPLPDRSITPVLPEDNAA